MGTSEDGEGDIVHAALNASMDASEFDDVQPAVPRISYVDETNTPDPTIPDPPKNAPRKSGSSDSGIPIWALCVDCFGWSALYWAGSLCLETTTTNT